MAKRAGLIVTMDELIDEVGTDVARYFFLARKNSTHLDFDLDLAKEQSNENPGWYVKYAHARICSVLRNAEAQGVKETPASEQDLELLTAESELTLCRLLPELPVLVSRTAFHQFYHNCRILTEDAALTRARLALSRATRVVLANTLDLMGMEAPERM
jgi:arginyl-tRNA synthetase